MNRLLRIALPASSLLFLTAFAETPASAATPPTAAPAAKKPRWEATVEEKARAVEALKRLDAMRAGAPKNSRKLFVTYICTADREPYPDYRARLDRAVRDVRDYYAAEMVSNGLPPITFDIETEADGLLKIHGAKIAEPLAALDKHANAGTLTKQASDKVLREAGIDPDNNHVLIVCQMPDGVSPYYGSGGNGDGRCWICDLPGFDPVNLASKLSKEETFKLAKNAEELSQFRGRALGAHTTVYMGGTAHELGHCFNLPHTGDSPEQEAMWGTSLMGGGNYTYGNDRRGEGKGAFLNPTDALRLISQPLFAKVDYRVREDGDAKFADLAAKAEGDGFRVTGRIASAKVPVYAVLVVYNFGTSGGDYASNSVSSLVDPATGEFSAVISRDHNGPVDLMITALHANGDTTALHTPTVSRGRRTDLVKLNLEWAFAPVKELVRAGKNAEAVALAKAVADRHPDSAAFATRAAVWARVLSAPVVPGASPAARPAAVTSVSLADCAAVSEKTGYGPMRPSRDRIPGADSIPRVGARVPTRSLFTHAPGAFVFDLGGSWKKLTGFYGVREGAYGKVGLEILGDGKKLHAGKTTGGAVSHDFSVDVTGVKQLEIRVTAPNGAGSAHGVLGDPALTR